MADTNPSESMDAEGLPSLEDRPPGIDAETDSEGLVVPRDHPIAVGDDPAYAVTAAEERQLETVQERAAREQPDFGAEELNVGGGAQTGDQVPPQPLGGRVEETLGAAGGPVSPEALAEAVEADDPLGTDLADDDLAATSDDEVRFYEPTSGDGVDFNHDGEALADIAEPTDEGISAEEAAVHVEDPG